LAGKRYLGLYKLNNLEYCKIYDMGYIRTGCSGCLFSYHMELKEGFDKFEKLKTTHPRLYNIFFNLAGYDEVLRWYPKRILREIKQ
jgi:hypothetical protein